MEAKKSNNFRFRQESNLDLTDFRLSDLPSMPLEQSYRQNTNNNLFNLDITTFFWGPKNSVNAENIESFIYMLFKLYMQV